MDPNVASFILFVITSVLLWFLFRESRVRKFLKTIPGPRAYPIIGNALEFLNPEEFVDKLSTYPETYGMRVGVILGASKILVLFHPNDVEKVLSSPALTPKSSFYNFFLPWLGLGIFISKGEKWRARRKMYIPIFHYKVLEGFQTVFNEQSQVMVDIMKEKIEAGKDVIKMHEMFMKCTLDIITATTLGLELNSQRDPDHFYAHAVAMESEYCFKRIISPWLHPDIIYNYSPLGRKEIKNRELMRDFVNQVIRERKQLLKSSNLNSPDFDDDNSTKSTKKRKPCILDMLLEEQKNENSDLSDEAIRDETNSVFFAGYDTTSSNLIWTLFLLGTNLDAQDEIHAELDQVFDGDRERPLTSADLSNLKYLECCIKESLRLYPPPVIGRTVEQDFQLDEKTLLPKGLDLLIAPWITHRLPEFYPDPLEYRPSRHFPENCKGRHPFAYIPFSGGPRNCMGPKFAMAEIKIILANIFRNFRVTCADDPAKVIILPEVISRPKGDIRFKLSAKE